ncbi:MAG: DNA-3-methyladenine glycosylase II, partial [Planctomycetota bacterium]
RAMIIRIITTDQDVTEGAEWLAKLDARFAQALREAGPLPLRRRPGGFDNLFNAIIGQQVSLASASAIWGRLEAADLTSVSTVRFASEQDLRDCGLSRQKIQYAHALANSGIDYTALEAMPDDDVIKTLVQVKGIGSWTAEVYTMFSLGRADVFAPGDLALQEAARVLFSLNERPNERSLRKMAQDWSPWRAVAARILWAYYRVIKNREGIS